MNDLQRARRSSRRKAETADINASKSRLIEPLDRADMFFAMNAVRRGMSVVEIAGFLGRTRDEVLEQIRVLQQTDYIPHCQ